MSATFSRILAEGAKHGLVIALGTALLMVIDALLAAHLGITQLAELIAGIALVDTMYAVGLSAAGVSAILMGRAQLAARLIGVSITVASAFIMVTPLLATITHAAKITVDTATLLEGYGAGLSLGVLSILHAARADVK